MVYRYKITGNVPELVCTYPNATILSPREIVYQTGNKMRCKEVAGEGEFFSINPNPGSMVDPVDVLLNYFEGKVTNNA